MLTGQKRTLVVLSLIGIAYFILFIFPNSSTLGSDNPLVFMHKDEYVTYPIVERMLALEGDIHTLWGSWIIYGDYHYGYPFYLLSSLILLPVRLIRGADFFKDQPFNILVLRQMVSVLPMILAAGILVWTQTKFRSMWKSILVFLFILTIPAVVRANMHWWHPDALMMLAISLTFFFLERDDFRLGKDFYLAAAACGMASAIKLMGFFFFLAVLGYLLFAWLRKNVPFNKVLRSASFFLVVMILVILLSNPFIFYKIPREEMLAIQREKATELTLGYPHENSLYYSLGPQYWRWTLGVSYGENWILLFLMISLGFGCLFGENKRTNWLMLGWLIPIGYYLFWFVAPKPDHYLLPFMLPLYSGVLGMEALIEAQYKKRQGWLKYLALGGLVMISLILLSQFVFQFSRDYSLYLSYF